VTKQNKKWGAPHVSRGSPNFNQEGGIEVEIGQKITLTIKEAAEYTGIGINKIYELLRRPNCSFVLYVGSKKLVKRKEFEDFIAKSYVI
jgi:excisionase family DNA binding protein